MRSKKAIKNTFSAIIYQLVSVICGLILPRLILSYFGSSYNGITSSISQFLQCASLLVAGVGGVTRAALYKPLAESNSESISSVLNATNKFVRKVALILMGSIIAFASLYPFLVISEFDWFFSFSLVIILGISTFMQYYFGLTYQMLLMADQRQYVVSIIQIFTTILNTILAIVLLQLGFGIHIVKLGSAFAFSLNPLFISLYVRKKYKIDSSVSPNNLALKQRWDAFWHSVANFIHNNTDIIVLTIFCDMKEVSVYTVYNYVISNIRIIIVNFITGFGAAFGNMLAKGEYETAKKNLRLYELIIFDLTAVIYITAGITIIPFVMLYTKNIVDVDYSRPIFAIIATVAGAFSCFRIPYQTIVEAAGHFKQTRNGAIFEAIINISISVIAVIYFGLIGVAVGTLVATVFRTIQYAVYLSKHIIQRSMGIYFGHIAVVFLTLVITLLITNFLFQFDTSDFMLWALKAMGVLSVCTVVTIILNLIFYREDLIGFCSKIKGMIFRRKK